MEYHASAFYIIAALLAPVFPADGITCLSCDAVVDPRLCETTRNCGPHEACFADLNIHPAGFITWNLGCRDRQQCAFNGRRDILTAHAQRRQNGLTLVCEDCCSGSSLCNYGLCGAQPFNSSRGPICYNCQQQISPSACDQVKLCSRDEVCKMNIKNGTGGIYESSCTSKQSCERDINVVMAMGIVGRKRSGYNHVMPAQGRPMMKCCDDDLCNTDSHTSPHQAVMSTQKPVTSSVKVTTNTPDLCISNPCMYGTCSQVASGYRCVCQLGYTGFNCDKGGGSSHIATPISHNQRYCYKDVVLVMDNSASMIYPETKICFAMLREILHDIYRNGLSDVRFALVTFGGTVRVEFDLSDFGSHASEDRYITALSAVNYYGSVTLLKRALETVTSSVLSTSAGDRPGADNVVVLFTDANFYENVALVARDLHSVSNDVITVSVGSHTNDALLSSLATDSDHMYKLTSCSHMTVPLIQTLVHQMCR